MIETRTIRRPAVAGTFYPRRAEALRDQVRSLLEEARRAERPAGLPLGVSPKALICPHAGYVYSGPTAARGQELIDPGLVRRVVLLGPAHYVGFRGLALSDASAFRTPLGDVPVDVASCDALVGLPGVVRSAAAHEPEHSLEVQLPLLQTLLPSFSLVPLVVGDATPAQVAGVLDATWGGPETLILISSDLSHYLTYDEANATDSDTLRRIMALEAPLPERRACGGRGINGLLVVAKVRGLRPILVDRRNSGDTAGERSRVVGYASVAFVDDRSEEAPHDE